jgi:hypothetical protein
MSEKERHIFIGTDGDQVVTYEKTFSQILHAKSLESSLEDEEGEPIQWEDLLTTSEGLFTKVLNDKKRRVNERLCLETRPNFCVITVNDGKAVRLEYYEGADRLRLARDLRSKELKGRSLPNFLLDDEVAGKAPCFRNVYVRYTHS